MGNGASSPVPVSESSTSSMDNRPCCHPFTRDKYGLIDIQVGHRSQGSLGRELSTELQYKSLGNITAVKRIGDGEYLATSGDDDKYYLVCHYHHPSYVFHRNNLLPAIIRGTGGFEYYNFGERIPSEEERIYVGNKMIDLKLRMDAFILQMTELFIVDNDPRATVQKMIEDLQRIKCLVYDTKYTIKNVTFLKNDVAGLGVGTDSKYIIHQLEQMLHDRIISNLSRKHGIRIQ